MKTNQKGISLIELMISVFISGLLTLAIITALVSTKGNFRIQKAASTIQETGQFTMQWLKREIQSAAYTEPILGQPESPIIFTSPTVPTGITPSQDNTGGRNPIKSDRLAIKYQNTGQQYDCDGKTIDPANAIVYSSYKIQNDARLMCTGNYEPQTVPKTTGTETVIENIESMQVLYGIDTDDPMDLYPNKYVDANDAKDTPLAVRSIRIALLVKSDESINAPNQTFTMLNEQEKTYTDGYLRQLFTATIPIRNAEILIP